MIDKAPVKPLPSAALILRFKVNYASDSAQAYQPSKSDLQRAVLKDRAITADQLTATQDHDISSAKCRDLKGIGITEDGTVSLRPNKGVSEEEANDMTPLSAASLARGEPVPTRHTREAFDHNAFAGMLAFTATDVETAPCFNDTLGPLGSK